MTMTQQSYETPLNAKQVECVPPTALHSDSSGEEDLRTPSILSWITAANERVGYDLRSGAVHPFPESLERLESVIARVRVPAITPAMLEPWAEVTREDVAAFEVTVSEQWPDE